ncbi:MAG TPA: hypothetical protein VFR67_12710, partial [Pilimelia sp.]|nr:hypothetical protein [Pilimelia sp.]
MPPQRRAPVIGKSPLPGPGAEELDWITFEQSGVVSTRQAISLLNEGTVRGLVRGGRWRSACRGVLVTHNGRLTRNQQLWVAVLAVGEGTVLAGATAASEAGVRGLRADPIHVLVPAARRAPRALLGGLPIDMPGVVVHRTTVLPEAHLQVGRPMRTSTARAVADAAAWARGDEAARVVVAAACQQRRVTPEEVLDVVAVLPK